MPSGTGKGSCQEGSFHVRSSSCPLDPVSEVRGVFSNRDLPSTSGGWEGQLRTVAIAYTML